MVAIRHNHAIQRRIGEVSRAGGLVALITNQTIEHSRYFALYTDSTLSYSDVVRAYKILHIYIKGIKQSTLNVRYMDSNS